MDFNENVDNGQRYMLLLHDVPDSRGTLSLNHPKSKQRLYKSFTVINIFVTVNMLIMLQL